MDGAKGKNGVEPEPESLSWVALALNRHSRCRRCSQKERLALSQTELRTLDQDGIHLDR